MSEGALQELPGGVLACCMPAQGQVCPCTCPSAHQAQVCMPALGRVSAPAARAVSQVSCRACFWWDGKQSHRRGLPHLRKLEPGMEGGVRAPAVSPGDSQGQGVSSCPSGRVSPTCTYSVVIGVMKHNWSAAVDDHKLFRRDRHRGRGSGSALH